MQNMSPPQNDTEKPLAIVSIAYRQSSTMVGSKDPAEEPKKVEETNQGNKQSNAVVRTCFADFQIQSVQKFLEFSRGMSESFRLFLEDMKARVEQFREQKQSIRDLLLEKWTQREQ